MESPRKKKPTCVCVCVCVWCVCVWGGGLHVQKSHKMIIKPRAAQHLGISVIQTERCGPLRAVLIKKNQKNLANIYITLWIYPLPPQNVYSSLLNIHLQLVWLAKPDTLSKTNHSSVWSGLVWMNRASNKETIVRKQVSILASSEHFTNTQN